MAMTVGTLRNMLSEYDDETVVQINAGCGDWNIDQVTESENADGGIDYVVICG